MVNVIQYGVDFILNLKPVQFKWKTGKRLHYGFIAQEVEPILPELISESINKDENGVAYKTLRMGDMLPVLVKAIQELNAKLEAQALEIATLKAK